MGEKRENYRSHSVTKKDILQQTYKNKDLKDNLTLIQFAPTKEITGKNTVN